MFVFTASDIIYGVILILAILWGIYKLVRNSFLKYKYRKCPVCGSSTGSYTDIRHSFIDDKVVSCEIYSCRSCNWSTKLYD